MKLKEIYQEVIKKGIEADPRGKKVIENILKEKKEVYQKLDKREKELFDADSLFNPFADTRILWGDPSCGIKSIIVGIDVEGEELLLVDSLRQKGVDIDLVISHHPQGHAYANFYEVMDLQVDIFKERGISLSKVETLLGERKAQVERRVSSANHQRVIDFARLLNLNFFCMHTPADNLAYQYIKKLMDKEKPKKIKDILDLLLEIPEYREAAKNNNPPKIFLGNKESRVSKIHIEFTGGTEGPENIYDSLSSAGIDTIIAMHQSEGHYRKCKQANINVVIASHIASDTLGVNLMLDYLQTKGKFKVLEFSGFKRFSHKR
ncbi:MAG: NGG1p interacting factor NIF3 [Candidatus Omnitrophota bacterium]|nr:MAG: NGG1p interacting factor NIF3 [Candidatus Omnitrophota bacterium]RKY46248.1 MAG: NGG1p interacting factor NIF3 [Candidatus Omnitrophota bacterium]HDN86065.1 NGG1p interacting factor NIF3 [Candidatus Omnitrophota bacterium]